MKIEEDDDIIIKGNPGRLILDWFKKNHWTVWGIIIILCLTWYDVATVQVQKKEMLEECNEFWVKEVTRVCPHAITGIKNPTAIELDNFTLKN